MNGESVMFEAALKPQPQDLAIFGGPPAFVEPLHVGLPNVGSREHLMERINDMLNRNWLTNDGPFVREFGKRIARFVGVRHCIAMVQRHRLVGDSCVVGDASAYERSCK
jgi:hypothetical protein